MDKRSRPMTDTPERWPVIFYGNTVMSEEVFSETYTLRSIGEFNYMRNLYKSFLWNYQDEVFPDTEEKTNE